VARNPVRQNDGALEIPHAVLDLSTCIRAETPNRDLGHADIYLGAGEWLLALEEIEAVLAGDMRPRSAFVDAALKHARALMPFDKD
jgi:hypothetical protein